MADTIAVMNRGRIEQLGTPTELYERPRTAFVAGFLGVSNLLHGTVDGAGRGPARRGRRDRVRARRPHRRASRSASAPRRSASARRSRARTALAGTVVETAYVGVATQYIVDTRRRRRSSSTSRTREPGAARSRRAPVDQLSWSPESDLRRRPQSRGGSTHEPPTHPSSSCSSAPRSAAPR